MYFHETENLRLDHDGLLYVVKGDDRFPLGYVDDAADAAMDLGLEDEYEEILDQWADSRYDFAGQVCSDYLSAKGR